jgi:hypothetical protein
MITIDVRCSHEFKFRISKGKAPFSNTKALFSSKFGFNLRKKLVNFYTWNTVLCGPEIGRFRKYAINTLKVQKCVAAEGRGR